MFASLVPHLETEGGARFPRSYTFIHHLVSVCVCAGFGSTVGADSIPHRKRRTVSCTVLEIWLAGWLALVGWVSVGVGVSVCRCELFMS